MTDERRSSTPQLEQQHPYQMSNDDETTPSADNANFSTLNDYGSRQMDDVINSEIGVATLLNRLKQSIASAKEFALFLKKRSTLEEEHANGLKKICRISFETIRRPDHRQGSYAAHFDEATRIHDRIADNGIQFSLSIQQMHEDLLEMASNMERGRKQWKQTGLTAEQRVADTETQMRKAKAKYDSLAEEYDRARTGDKQAGKKFGLKGPKSAAQHEEDLLRKLQAADQDYAAKVTNAQLQREELLSTSRPQAVKAIQDLIKECDSALCLQLQKFASYNEKLLLSNGLNISPIKGNGKDPANQNRSLRDVVRSIDNEADLKNYLVSHASKVPPRISEIKYEKHPSLVQSTQQAPPTQTQRTAEPFSSVASRQAPPTTLNQTFGGVPQSPGASYNQGPTPTASQHERSFSQGPGSGQPSNGNNFFGGSHQRTYSGSMGSNGAPQLSTLPFQTSEPPLQLPAAMATPPYSQGPLQIRNTAGNAPSYPPNKPVFGVSLEKLFERDGSAVPLVVYQCIQAVDLFGLEVEGLYRLSGTASHINQLKGLFDNDSASVDFRVPENFFHDVNSVAGLLKQFFRELPDPLLTNEHYDSFIKASKHEDETLRRDSLHAIINSLPDPNYATLRAITLHLHQVQKHQAQNRMGINNLAIVFGPTLMGGSAQVQDAGHAIRVIETILHNTFQIFDED